MIAFKPCRGGIPTAVLFGAALTLSLFLSASRALAQDTTSDTQKKSDESPLVLPKFVVTAGIRSSVTAALDFKRNSTQIVDSIVSEDIGKFPDNNLVEALQRVAGIQVTGRASGEIATVTIRGLPDINTTWNGQNIFTASGQYYALQDVPASLLKQVVIYKTRSADLIENGIAGSIDVQTHRPFDFSGPKFVLDARAIYADQAGKTGENISALFSNRWETSAGQFGAMVNFSYVRTPYRDQNATAGAEVPFMTSTPPAGWVPYERIFPTDGRASENPIWTAGLLNGLSESPTATLKINGQDTPYVLSRDAVFQNDFTGTRTRPGFDAAFQWAPSKTAEYTLEGFYTGYRNTSFNDLLFSFVDWWGGPLGTVTLYPGTNIVQSRALVSYPYSFTSGDITDAKTDSYAVSLSGRWFVGNALTLRSALTYQSSEFKSSFFAMRADRVAPSISVNFNPGNGVVAFQFPDDITNPALWNIAQLYDNGNKNKGSAITWNGDGDYKLNGFVKSLKFGVRYDDRKASEAQRTQSADSLGVPLSTYPELEYVNSNFFDGHSDVPTAWVVPNGHVVYANADKYRAIYQAKFPAFKTSDQLSLFENFHVDEKNVAAYLRADFEADLGGHRLTGQVGARAVDVKTDMTFTDQGTLVTSTASASKTKLLPSGSLRFEIAPDLIARASYSETLRRPNFVDLNPAINYVKDVTNIGYGTATGGNPNLKPTQSKNYDLSLEYYYARSSAIYATAFERDIDGLVVSFRKRVTYQNYDYILTQPDNASNGKLRGVEVGATYFPDNLPGILKGFGVIGSFTHLNSKQDIPQTDSAGNVTSILSQGFFQVSNNSYSGILAYERSWFSGRLSYTWRSAFLDHYEAALFANPLGVFHNPEESLDLQLTFRVTKRLTLTVDATNLTNEIYQQYYGSWGATTNNFSSSLYSRTFAVGARYSF